MSDNNNALTVEWKHDASYGGGHGYLAVRVHGLSREGYTPELCAALEAHAATLSPFIARTVAQHGILPCDLVDSDEGPWLVVRD